MGDGDFETMELTLSRPEYWRICERLGIHVGLNTPPPAAARKVRESKRAQVDKERIRHGAPKYTHAVGQLIYALGSQRIVVRHGGADRSVLATA